MEDGKADILHPHSVNGKPLLTIAIPTYNRNDKLSRSLAILLPQLNEQVRVVVLDNASPIPVLESLGTLLDNSAVKIIRNKYNVGVSSNLIKCFESCETEWMWLLGDDDPPTPDAVSIILQDIQENRECSFLNYKSHMSESRQSDFYSVGVDDFIQKIDNFGNVLFISLGVYNLHRLEADIRLTHQLAYCLAPHLVYLISGIKESGTVGFLSRKLHDFSLYDTVGEENWSWVSLSFCFPILYEIPLNISEASRKVFARHVLTHVKSPREIFEILEQPRYYNTSTKQKRFLLRQIYFRSLLHNGLDKLFLHFIYYDLKLYLKNILMPREVKTNMERDDRV